MINTRYSGLSKKNNNTKIIEIGSKLSSMTGLTTTAALNVVENRTPNVSDLVPKK